MKIKVRQFKLAEIISFALIVFTIPANAEYPEVAVEVIPSEVKLLSKGEGKALVIVRNRSDYLLRDVQFSWFIDGGVKVLTEVPKSKDLFPYGSLVWTLKLLHNGEGLAPSTVHIRVDYTWQRNGMAKAVPGVSLGALQVKAREPEAIEQVAEVRVETVLSSLKEHRPGTVYLVVTNISDIPIQVMKILPNGPEFVKFTPPDTKGGVTIGPREIHAFSVKVEATETVRPGKHLLLFEVTFTWEKANRIWTGNSIASHEVGVGIFGETEILAAVGVPSFLVLPGFLMLITLGLLWKYVAPRTEFFLKLKTPEFWLIAITLSVITALIYPVVTGWFGVSRNYLEGYGLGDVVRVWLASIIFTASAHFIVAFGIDKVRSIKAWYWKRKVQRHTPSAKDTPIAVLYKLHIQGLGIILERVDIKVRGKIHRAYLLEPKREGQNAIWVGPNIIVKWLKQADSQFRQKVEEHLGATGKANILAKLLEEGSRGLFLQVMWKRMSQLTKPYKGEMADIQDYHEPNAIVEQE